MTGRGSFSSEDKMRGTMDGWSSLVRQPKCWGCYQTRQETHSEFIGLKSSFGPFPASRL
jgi:hypothetical protein